MIVIPLHYTRFQGSGSQTVRFAYDGFSRLASASIIAGNMPLAQYSYDANSNPLEIKRWGMADRDGDGMEWGLIDDLAFSYQGNQLSAAAESADALTYAGANDMEAGTFQWDANGCLASDTSRGISSIKYNRLNQPTLVRMGTNVRSARTAFVYDANGTKISQIDSIELCLYPFSVGGGLPNPRPLYTVHRTDYWGGCVYEDGALKRVLFPGGYATPNGDGTYAYHYFQTDYQGNVRAVLSENGALEEANSYYPYGMLMAGDDGELPALQPYKYSGKEYVTIHGLNQYDFGPRPLFSPAAIFTSPDRKAGDYPWLSPYVYCAANPINLVDPTGNRIIISKDVSTEELFRILYDLQSLTDDKLVFKLTEAGFMVKIASLGKTNQYPVGTNLIRELNSSSKAIKISTKRINNNEFRSNRDKTNLRINLDYNFNPKILTENVKSYRNELKHRPSFIGLAHELVHAYRDIFDLDKTTSGTYNYVDQYGKLHILNESEEELETIGIKGESKYNENKIRKEHKLDRRIKY